MQALTHADASPASRWMPTLLATLLVMLCFTVVLLSFSRPDYRRFAQVADEFGDQRLVTRREAGRADRGASTEAARRGR